MDMLKIGLSGLLTTQYGLTVTSNNIANANTEGYSRQELVTSSPSSVQIGGEYYGQGVHVSDVRRVGSDYLEVALRDSVTSKIYHERLYSLGVEVDKMLSNQDTGLDKSLQGFFTSVGDLANSPSSQATRNVVLDDLQSVGFKYESMSAVLSLSRQTVDKDLVAYVGQINSLADDIVSINDALVDAKSQTGEFPSQLLDARYRALTELAKYTDIQVDEGLDGSSSVYIAGGIGLVSNNIVNKVEARPDGYADGQYEVYIKGQEVSDRITGGYLGASLQYRTEILNESENELGRTAIAFSQMLNIVHKQGTTPAGVAGGNLVSDFAAVGQSHVGNTGTGSLSVTFDTSGSRAAQEVLIGQLKSRTYGLVDNGAGFDVYDSDTGSLLTTQPTGVFTFEGLDFNLTGASNLGDQFRISPMQKAIDNFKVVLSNPQDIATSQDPAGSSSDNRNTLDLYEIKSAKVLDNGLDTVQGAYSTLISGVGSRVSMAESAELTSGVLYDQAFMHRESVSGVNVEEEAARILELQQRYSASAKVIQTAREIFDIFMQSI